MFFEEPSEWKPRGIVRRDCELLDNIVEMRPFDKETEQIVIVEDVTNSPRFVGLIAVCVSLIEQANTTGSGY